MQKLSARVRKVGTEFATVDIPDIGSCAQFAALIDEVLARYPTVEVFQIFGNNYRRADLTNRSAVFLAWNTGARKR